MCYWIFIWFGNGPFRVGNKSYFSLYSVIRITKMGVKINMFFYLILVHDVKGMYLSTSFHLFTLLMSFSNIFNKHIWSINVRCFLLIYRRNHSMLSLTIVGYYCKVYRYYFDKKIYKGLKCSWIFEHSTTFYACSVDVTF